MYCPQFCTFSYFHSGRPWSLILVFFIILSILGPLLPFLFGRVMVIETFAIVRVIDLLPSSHFLIIEQSQNTTYSEVMIAGDLSEGDTARAHTRSIVVKVSHLLGIGLPVLMPLPDKWTQAKMVLAPLWRKRPWNHRVPLRR